MAGNSALRQYRKDKNLTQEALAKELGVTGVAVSRWETGTRKIDRELLPDISEKTGIAPRDLRPDLAALIEAAQ